MDTFEAAKVVHERTLKIETEQIAKKVVGYVYFQDYPDQVMIRLVLGPDNFIQYLMLKAKVALQLSSAHVGSLPSSPSVNPISIPDPLLQYARFPSLSCHRVLPHRLTGACHWEHRQIEKQVPHLEVNQAAKSNASSPDALHTKKSDVKMKKQLIMMPNEEEPNHEDVQDDEQVHT